jgi:hypothetical protein
MSNRQGLFSGFMQNSHQPSLFEKYKQVAQQKKKEEQNKNIQPQ